ncbi:MAG: energy transducer TonB family protein [Spirochaetota bacterium]
MRRDGRRMMVSVTAALLIHAVVFVVVQFVARVEPEMPEYGGPLTVTLADSLEPPQAARPGDKESPEQAALRPGEPATEKAPAPEQDPTPGHGTAPSGGPGESTGSGDTGTREPVPYTETRPQEIDEPTTYHAPVRRRRDAGKILEGKDFSPSWQEELDQEDAGGAAGGGAASADAGDAGAGAAGAPDAAREEAAGEDRQAGGLDLGRIDRALEQAEGTTGRPVPSGEGEPAEEYDRPGDVIAGDAASQEGPDITWEDASQGRRLLSPAEDPRIPEWVQREGLYLTVTVSFTVTPLGHTTGLRVDKSSGYPDVDAAVTQAVRGLRFNPVQGADPARGSIRYIINTR